MTDPNAPAALHDDDLDSSVGAMTQNDLAGGRLIAEIGVAAIKPAEFVVFRIGQKTADSRG